MNVLLLGPFPPPEGGVARNVAAIRDAVIGEGGECTVVCTTRNSSRSEKDNIFVPRNPFEFVYRVRKHKADLVHLHIGGRLNIRIFFLFALCLMINRHSAIVTIHSGELGILSLPRHYAVALRHLLNRFRWIIAVNRQIAAALENLGVNPTIIQVISPFVPPNILTEQIPEHLNGFMSSANPLLVSVGGLEPEYDIEVQIDALRLLIHRFPKIGLIIIGSGKSEYQLRERILEARLQNRVLIAGELPHPLTATIIRTANLLLRTTKFDGDSISVREALHFGIPVVATDNGMRPEGVVCIPTPADKEHLAQAIVATLDSHYEYNRPTAEGDTNGLQSIINLYKTIDLGRRK